MKISKEDRALHFDVIIVGSGLAGLALALNLAEHKRVAIVTKRGLLDGASNWSSARNTATSGLSSCL